MRRTFLAGLGTAVLVTATLPAASAKPVDVDGNRFAESGVTALSHGCVDRRAEPVEAPDLRLRQGPKNPPLGTHSAGWATHGLGFGAGFSARIKHPAKLERFRIELYSPSQEAQGHAVVRLHPEGDTGYWFGNAELPADTKRGWHPVNAANRTFSWTHYTAEDTIDRTGTDATIQEFTTTYAGGNGDGAELGFVFGCDENVFYVDRLELRTAKQKRIFDFGGFRTRTKLWVGQDRPRSVVLSYGNDLGIFATLHDRATDDRRSAALRFEARPMVGGSWRTVGKDRTGTDARASTVVQPRRGMLYRVRFPGTDRHERSTSRVLKVFIRDRVSAHLVDGTITKGQSFTVAGQVNPKIWHRILLQRYRDGSWRTVKKGSTARDGGFRISAVSSTAGTSWWRIKTASGQETRGNVSKSLKLTTKNPSGDPNPPPPDDEEPPPPPPPPEG